MSRVIVKRNSDNKTVYGNTGEDIHDAQFMNDIIAKGFNGPEYTTTIIPLVDIEENKKKVKRDALLLDIEAIAKTKVLADISSVDIKRVVRHLCREMVKDKLTSEDL